MAEPRKKEHSFVSKLGWIDAEQPKWTNTCAQQQVTLNILLQKYLDKDSNICN